MSSSRKQVKQKGRCVPSRYKESAETIAHHSKRSREVPPLPVNSRDGQFLSITCQSFQDACSSKSAGFQGGQGMTSTPAIKSGSSVLESTITKAEGNDSATFLKEKTGSSLKSVKSRKKKESFNEQLAEAEMDLLYAEYLQMTFLVSEAKKTLELRSDSSMETVSKLCNLILQYRSEVQSQNSLLKIMSTLVKTQEHLQKQDDLLKPVFGILPTLAEKYQSLAEAVSVVKHKLTVKDVQLPNPGHEGDIQRLLEEIRKFLSEFFEQNPQLRDLIFKANEFENYADKASLLKDGLYRGFSLLDEARDLQFSEASLALSSKEESLDPNSCKLVVL